LRSYLNSETISSDHERKWENKFYDNALGVKENASLSPASEHTTVSATDMVQKVLQQAPSVKIHGNSEIDSSTRLHDEALNAQLLEIQRRLRPILKAHPFVIPEREWLVQRNKLNYEGRRRFSLADNLPLLLAWTSISQLTAQTYGAQRVSGDPFGTGFLLDNDAAAMAVNSPETQAQYVLLNPDYFYNAVKTQKIGGDFGAQGEFIRTLACHELAHLSNMDCGHGSERFTSKREDIQLCTVGLQSVCAEIAQACLGGGKAPKTKITNRAPRKVSVWKKGTSSGGGRTMYEYQPDTDWFVSDWNSHEAGGYWTVQYQGNQVWSGNSTHKKAEVLGMVEKYIQAHPDYAHSDHRIEFNTPLEFMRSKSLGQPDTYGIYKNGKLQDFWFRDGILMGEVNGKPIDIMLDVTGKPSERPSEPGAWWDMPHRIARHIAEGRDEWYKAADGNWFNTKFPHLQYRTAASTPGFIRGNPNVFEVLRATGNLDNPRTVIEIDPIDTAIAARVKQLAEEGN
jgi:hypothetical protein